MLAEVDSSSTHVPSPCSPEKLKCSDTDYRERSVSKVLCQTCETETLYRKYTVT